MYLKGKIIVSPRLGFTFKHISIVEVLVRNKQTLTNFVAFILVFR